MRYFMVFGLGVLVGSWIEASAHRDQTDWPVPAVTPAQVEIVSGPTVCIGSVSVASFEAALTNEQSFAYDGELITKFVELWLSGRRPMLPMIPDRVVVYSVSGKDSYIVSYQADGCIIAFLGVERERFVNWLRPLIGWQA